MRRSLRVTDRSHQGARARLSIADVNATLAITFGSAYANDFSREGRVLRVLLQADAPYRMTPRTSSICRVRSASGEMVSVRRLHHGANGPPARRSSSATTAIRR